MSKIQDFKMYINGEWVDSSSGKKIKTLNPEYNEKLGIYIDFFTLDSNNLHKNLNNINKKSPDLNQLANCIRFLSIDAVQKAKSGHPGMPMGMADIATILFKEHLKQYIRFLQFESHETGSPSEDPN